MKKPSKKKKIEKNSDKSSEKELKDYFAKQIKSVDEELKLKDLIAIKKILDILGEFSKDTQKNIIDYLKGRQPNDEGGKIWEGYKNISCNNISFTCSDIK